jgi:putative DNA primase/helicase
MAASKVPSIEFHTLEQATAAAWRALKRANDGREHGEFLFRHGDQLCRLEFNDSGRLTPRTLDAARMRYRLSEGRVARWVKRNPKGELMGMKAAPQEVVGNVLAAPNPDLPIVSRIMEAPVMAPDGSVHDKPGYNAKSKVFLHPRDGLKVPTIKQRPSARDVRKARTLILREVFGDFPFVGKAERAHAVCLLLQPFVRGLINGPTPLYIVESPTPGTGKGLLVDVACYPAIGGPVEVTTAPESEDEWRKKITAALLASAPVIFIDNISGSLSSAVLSAALTTPVWTDRRLGRNEQLSLPNMATWVTAGNNPGLSKEIQRRGVRIRQDAKVENPEDRRDFRHADLRGWVRANHGQLIWAALTLARAWAVAGRPEGAARLGSFEDWSAVMGGILEVAEVPGFLANQDAFRENAQSENDGMYEFLSDWRAQYGDMPVMAKDLRNKSALMVEQHLGIDASKASAPVMIGKALGRHRDRRFGDLMLIMVSESGGVKKWTVQETGGDDE